MKDQKTTISFGDFIDCVKAICYIAMAARIIIAIKKRFT